MLVTLSKFSNFFILNEEFSFGEKYITKRFYFWFWKKAVWRNYEFFFRVEILN